MNESIYPKCLNLQFRMIRVIMINFEILNLLFRELNSWKKILMDSRNNLDNSARSTVLMDKNVRLELSDMLMITV